MITSCQVATSFITVFAASPKEVLFLRAMAMVHAVLCQKAWIAGTISACALAFGHEPVDIPHHVVLLADAQEDPCPSGGVGPVDRRQ